MYDKNGNRKQKWISTKLNVKGNKRAATQLLQKTISEYEESTSIDKSLSLFCDFLCDWLELHKSEIQITTYNGYRHMVDKYMYPYFSSNRIKLVKLKPMDIQKYFVYLKDTANLSPNTIIKHRQLIHRCLEYALRNRYITENACNYVDKIKRTRTEHTFLELDSINQLITIIKGDKIETAVLIAIYYGLRRSEVLGLTWDCIDFENNRLIVRQKVVRTFDDNHKLGIHISDELKTSSSYRDFPLFPDIKQHLTNVRKTIGLNKKCLGSEYCSKYSNFICVDEKGVLLNPDYISSRYRKLVKKYNLPKSSFHSLRHSCASLLLSNGYNIKEIQQWLGHSNYQTTSDIYSHTEDKFKDNIVKSLSEVIQYNKKTF